MNARIGIGMIIVIYEWPNKPIFFFKVFFPKVSVTHFNCSKALKKNNMEIFFMAAFNLWGFEIAAANHPINYA